MCIKKDVYKSDIPLKSIFILKKQSYSVGNLKRECDFQQEPRFLKNAVFTEVLKYLWQKNKQIGVEEKNPL